MKKKTIKNTLYDRVIFKVSVHKTDYYSITEVRYRFKFLKPRRKYKTIYSIQDVPADIVYNK